MTEQLQLSPYAAPTIRKSPLLDRLIGFEHDQPSRELVELIAQLGVLVRILSSPIAAAAPRSPRAAGAQTPLNWLANDRRRVASTYRRADPQRDRRRTRDPQQPDVRFARRSQQLVGSQAGRDRDDPQDKRRPPRAPSTTTSTPPAPATATARSLTASPTPSRTPVRGAHQQAIPVQPTSTVTTGLRRPSARRSALPSRTNPTTGQGDPTSIPPLPRKTVQHVR